MVALASDDVWAVGHQGAQSLIEHWDGSSWSVVPSPSPGNLQNFFGAITAVAPNDIWAGGGASSTGGRPSKVLFAHWNGRNWTQVDAAASLLTGRQVFAMSRSSSANVWAVGEVVGAAEGQDSVVVQRWNGSSWTNYPVPRAMAYSSGLSGVATLPTGESWAVGFIQPVPGTVNSFIRHFVPCDR